MSFEMSLTYNLPRKKVTVILNSSCGKKAEFLFSLKIAGRNHVFSIIEFQLNINEKQ